MKKTGISLFLLCCAIGAFSQTIQEIQIADPAVENYFVVEPKGEIKGAMILLPGGSLAPESIFPETKLHNVAYLHNILVVAMPYGRNTIYLTDNTLHIMNTVLRDVMARYGIANDKFVIGGYSGGGITALCYTVHSKQFPGKTVIDPQAVFTAAHRSI